MGGEHTGQQHRGQDRVVQGIDPHQGPQDHGDRKAHQAQKGTFQGIVPKILHVDLQSGQEHDVQQPGGSRKDDAAVPGQEVQAMGTDQDPGDDHSQQMGEFKLVRDQGYQENDQEDDQKFKDRV